MTSPAALLLDIDGVVVLEVATSPAGRPELFLLHSDLGSWLRGLDEAVFFVTHRSRREAELILACAGLSDWFGSRCFAAEDILRAAIRHGRLSAVLKEGLRKSLVLPEIRARFGLPPEALCFVDDRPENLSDMCDAGVGLGLLAPSGVVRDGLLTFDLAEMVATFRGKAGRGADRYERGRPILELSPREQPIDIWCRTNLNTKRSARSFFNVGRRIGRRFRQLASRPW